MAMGVEQPHNEEPDAELDAPSEEDPNLTVREFNKLRDELRRMWNPTKDQETRGVPNHDQPLGNPPANAGRPKGNPPANNDSDTPEELDTSLPADEQREIDLEHVPGKPGDPALGDKDVAEQGKPVGEPLAEPVDEPKDK